MSLIICPVCGAHSGSPEDIEHGYCGYCHETTSGHVFRGDPDKAYIPLSMRQVARLADGLSVSLAVPDENGEVTSLVMLSPRPVTSVTPDAEDGDAAIRYAVGEALRRAGHAVAEVPVTASRGYPVRAACLTAVFNVAADTVVEDVLAALRGDLGGEGGAPATGAH